MFVWNDRPNPRRKLNDEARQAMYRRELEERAALLYRLGYSQKRCRERLRGNVAWDFELHGRPRHSAEVDRIVDTVYRRGAVSGGAPSV
jgi:hypothetical protein